MLLQYSEANSMVMLHFLTKKTIQPQNGDLNDSSYFKKTKMNLMSDKKDQSLYHVAQMHLSPGLYTIFTIFGPVRDHIGIRQIQTAQLWLEAKSNYS